MSNVIPPLLSSSPPPIVANEDEEDDEFGDFAAAGDLSFNCSSLSLPASPAQSPTKTVGEPNFEVNSDSSDSNNSFKDASDQKPLGKDYQDKRKDVDSPPINHCKNKAVNIVKNEDVDVEDAPCELSAKEDCITPVRNLLNCNVTAVPCDVPKETSDFNHVPTKTHSSDLALESVTSKSLSGSVFDSSENQAVKNGPVCILKDNQTASESEDIQSSTQDDFGDFSDHNITNSNPSNCSENCMDVPNSAINNLEKEPNQKRDTKMDEEENFAPFLNHESLKQNFTVDFNTNSAVSELSNGKLDSPYFEEPPDLPPDIEFEEDSCDYENQSLELDSESDSQHMPSESLVPFKENKDDYNYIGIIRSVRDATILVNAPPESITIDEPLEEKNESQDDSEFGEFNDFQTENGVIDEFSNFKISSDADNASEFDAFKTTAFNGFPKDIPFADDKDYKNGDNISFADFSSIGVSLKVPQEEKEKLNTTEVSNNEMEDDTFGDFSTFESEVATNGPEVHQKLDVITDSQPTFSDEGEEDDFGDFDDYSSNSVGNNTFGDFSAGQKESLCLTDTKDVPKQAEKILMEMFPVVEGKNDEFSSYDFVVNDFVFKEIKDVTETNALTYQWPKSSSQEIFLKALNIDMRNILHGPGWNPSMPRFASNLGLAPLEPVKSEILTPTPAQTSSVLLPTPVQPSTNTSNNQNDIPSAQFDWTSSGLTNPLDYSQATMMLLDLEQLVASLDIPSTISPSSGSRNSPTLSRDYDDWDNWLKTLPKDITEKSNIADTLSALKLDDQSPVGDIATKQFDSESVNSLQLTESPIEYEENPEDTSTKKAPNEFENFGSFQSVPVKIEELNWPPDNMVPLRESHISINEQKSKKIETEPGWLKPTLLTPDLPKKILAEEIVEDEDDFSDFQMVLPETLKVEKKEPLKPIPVLEPLKPEVLQPQPSVPTEINWPDPGNIDELEILSAFSYKSVEKTKKAEKKVEANDDDDWTDFVSNQEVLPAPKPNLLGFKGTERTSTPELQLSIGQLSQIQPPKQPVPLITPHGLMQTKLPTNVFPKMKVDPIPSMLKPNNDGFQPAIISQQYNAQMGYNPYNTTTFWNHHQINTNYNNTSLNQFNANKNNQDDDEDWSDFVSSQPAPSAQNGGTQTNWNQRPQFQQNWTAASTSPNIISNPGFSSASLRNKGPPHRTTTVSVPLKKSSVPSISALPDLDFVAPKSRTAKK